MKFYFSPFVIIIIIIIATLDQLNAITVNPSGVEVSDSSTTINFNTGPFPNLTLKRGDKIRIVTGTFFDTFLCAFGCGRDIFNVQRNDFDACTVSPTSVRLTSPSLATIPPTANIGDIFLFINPEHDNRCLSNSARLQVTVVEEDTKSPTTNAPSTSNPSTSNPSTSNPTTRAPSTKTPTLNAPSTNVPSTLTPTNPIDQINNNNNNNNNNSVGLGPAAIAGIAIASLVALLIIYLVARESKSITNKAKRMPWEGAVTKSNTRGDPTSNNTGDTVRKESDASNASQSSDPFNPSLEQSDTAKMSQRLEFTKLLGPLKAIPEHRSLSERFRRSTQRFFRGSTNNSSRFSSSADDSIEARLYRFYRDHDPDKIDDIEEFLAEWRHFLRKPEGLVAFNLALKKKYGHDLSSVAASLSSIREDRLSPTSGIGRLTPANKRPTNRFTWVVNQAPDV